MEQSRKFDCFHGDIHYKICANVKPLWFNFSAEQYTGFMNCHSLLFISSEKCGVN